MNLKSKIKALEKEYPKVNISDHIIYFIEGKMLVPKPVVEKFFNVSGRAISNWEKKGYEASKYSLKTLRLYDIDDIRDWHKENMSQTRSIARADVHKVGDVGDKLDDDTPDYSNIEDEINDINGKIKQANEILQMKSTTQKEADRIDKIMGALTKAAKLGEQMGELIPKRDTEKIIVEMIATLISGYKKDIKILPQECAKRNENEIRNILETNYKSTIENYQKLSKSDLLSENKLFDVLGVVMRLLEDNISVDTIIGRLNETN